MKIYLETIENIKTDVLSLIEKERKVQVSGQNNTELVSLTEFALGETDRFFEQVIGLPGKDEESYRCRLLMIEALEDLRESFEKRFSADRVLGNLNDSYWQTKRAGYLLKMQAAEQEVRNLMV